MLHLALTAALAGPATGSDVLLRGPITEVRHPVYVDANGVTLSWRDVRGIAKGSSAVRKVRQRRWGRTVLRLGFAGVTVVEGWGTWRLAEQGNYMALPLAGQTASTGLVAVLLWTSAPQQRLRDRALILDGANGVLPR